MGSRFYFGNSDDSGSDLDDNDSSLPFPKPLARSAFLAPDFDPTTFLSSLSSRYQTLEDLRKELRDLSQSLNKELLDLVNDNYQDFLSLGSTLSGGEEKIEEVRLGLLAFHRDLGAVKEKVETRRSEVFELLQEKRTLKQDIGLGRNLIEIADRIEELEGQLMIGEARSQNATNGAGENKDLKDEDLIDSLSEDSDESDSLDQGASIVPLRRYQRRVEQYLVIKILVRRQSSSHPFLLKQGERLQRIRTTLFLDLRTALKEEAGINGIKESPSQSSRVQMIKRLCKDLEEEETSELAIRNRTI